MRLFGLALLLLCACNAVSQSPECAQYLACIEAVRQGASVNFASYAEGGSCWSTDQRSADNCTEACVQGRQLLGTQAGAGKPECL